MNDKLKEIRDRFRAESPNFFKKLTNVMVGIGAVGLAIVAAPVALPTALITAAGYAIAIGTTGAAISKLTKK
jgi:hypothetical protein